MYRSPALGAFVALNLRWAYECVDVEHADALDDLLGGMVDTGGVAESVVSVVATVPGHVRVTIGEDEVYGSLRIGSLVSHSLIEINRRATATWAGPVLHAGAVVVDGRAVALCGRSGSGKTTLTAALGAAGYPMLADEVCALDDDDVVQPYGKPLALRPPSIVALGQGLPPRAVTRFEEDETFVALSSLAGGVGSAVPLDVVVFPEYAPDEPCTVEPMSPGECLVELIHHTLASRCTQVETFEQLRRIASRARAWRMRSGDLAAAVEAVAALSGQREHRR